MVHVKTKVYFIAFEMKDQVLFKCCLMVSILKCGDKRWLLYQKPDSPSLCLGIHMIERIRKRHPKKGVTCLLRGLHLLHETADITVLNGVKKAECIMKAIFIRFGKIALNLHGIAR